MDKLEFARDLDKYLAARNNPRFLFWKKLFARTPKIVSVQASASVGPQPVTVSTAVEVQVTDDDKVSAKEYDSEKKSFVLRVLEWLVAGSPEKHDSVAPEEVASALIEKELHNDMRELARISIATFRKLPAHKIREFKGSLEYNSFRGILKKHGLAKE